MRFDHMDLHEKVDLLIRMVLIMMKEEFKMADEMTDLQDAFDRHESSVKDAVAEIVRLVGKVGNPALTQKVKDITAALDSSTQELKDAVATAEPAPAPVPAPEPVPAPVDGGTPTA